MIESLLSKESIKGYFKSIAKQIQNNPGQPVAPRREIYFSQILFFIIVVGTGVFLARLFIPN